MLSGPVDICTNEHEQTTLVTHTLHVENFLTTDDEDLGSHLKSFWELESFGIAKTDHSVLDTFHGDITFTGGRYEVSLPWKNPNQLIPDNYQLCVGRMRGLLRRMRDHPEILREYDLIIRTQREGGIVEYVDESPQEQPGRVHYLPHHPVIRRDKQTTKVRVVYDASAKSRGPSLNDCLYVGPKFDQRIFDILLRFRVHNVALTADIEKAFLMVSVSPKDCDVLRFLWTDDITSERPIPVDHRFTRVVFGVSSSPFLLNATIRYHIENTEADTELVSKLTKSFYVDDLIAGAGD